MRREFTWLVCIICLACYSCSGNSNKPTAASTTAADSLYHLAIGYHDEAMPRMNELMAYEDRVDHIIDSLTEMENSRSLSTSGYQLQTWLRLKQKIANAVLSMNNWMDNFEAEPMMENEDSITLYFQKQAAGAKAMRDSMFFAIDTLKIYLPTLATK